MAATVDAVSAVAKQTDGSLALTITKPSGVISGDLLVAVVNQNGNPGPSWTSSGWTEVVEAAQASIKSSYLYKIAGGSEPASYDFASGISNQKIGRIWRISDHAASWQDYTPTPAITDAQTTAVAPSETTTQDDVLVIFACGADRNRLSAATPPSGLTDEQHDDTEESANAAGLCSGWLLQASAGATGTKAWTFETANSEQSNGFTIGIRSAGVATAAQPASLMLGL